MKSFLKSILFFSALLLITCSNEETTLTMSMEPEKSFVLPGSEYFCGFSDRKVTGPRVRWPKIRIRFKEYDKYLTIVQIRFKITSGSSKSSSNAKLQLSSCSVDGDILDYMMGIYPGTVSGTTTTASGHLQDSTLGSIVDGQFELVTQCGVVCGVTLDESQGPTVVTGTAELFGFTGSGTEEQIPIKATSPIQIQYVP